MPFDVLRSSTLVAACAVLVYGLIIGYIDNHVRIIAREMGLWQFQFLRTGMMMAVVFAAMALSLCPSWRPKRLRWVLARSVLATGALTIYFGCLGFLSVAQASAGLFSAPIFVLLIGRIWFGHRLGVAQILGAFAGFVGMLLVLAPDPQQISALSLLPLAAGALYALSNIATREWCAEETAAALTIIYMLVVGALGGIVMTVVWIWGGEAPAGAAGFLVRGPIWPSGEVLFWVFVQAVGSLVAVALLVHAYHLVEAARVAVFEYVVLPLSALWSYLLWSEAISAISVYGIALIIGAALLNLWIGARAPKPAL